MSSRKASRKSSNKSDKSDEGGEKKKKWIDPTIALVEKEVNTWDLPYEYSVKKGREEEIIQCTWSNPTRAQPAPEAVVHTFFRVKRKQQDEKRGRTKKEFVIHGYRSKCCRLCDPPFVIVTHRALLCDVFLGQSKATKASTRLSKGRPLRSDLPRL